MSRYLGGRSKKAQQQQQQGKKTNNHKNIKNASNNHTRKTNQASTTRTRTKTKTTQWLLLLVLVICFGWILCTNIKVVIRQLHMTTTMTNNNNTTNNNNENKNHDNNDWKLNIINAPSILTKTSQTTNNTNQTTTIHQQQQQAATIILGFANEGYQQDGVNWYKRLKQLGYNEHLLVAVTPKAAQFFKQDGTVNYTTLPHEPCSKRQIEYRRQLYALRWKFVFEQLQTHNRHVLLTDVDNIFVRHVPMSYFEQSLFDIYHAFSNPFPKIVADQMGFTFCGGMIWLRSTSANIQFVRTLLQKRCQCELTWNNTNPGYDNTSKHCNLGYCKCDDQVAMNHMRSDSTFANLGLDYNPFQVTWDFKYNYSKYDNILDWPSVNGKVIDQNTNQTTTNIHVWNRSFAYRGDIPSNVKDCPKDNWVAMPFGERKNRAQLYEDICNNKNNDNDNNKII